MMDEAQLQLDNNNNNNSWGWISPVLFILLGLAAKYKRWMPKVKRAFRKASRLKLTDRILKEKDYDRLRFVLLYMDVIVTVYIFGAYPERMYLWWLFKGAVLLPSRIRDLYKAKQHLYNFELCLWHNYFLAIYLLIDDSWYEWVFGGGLLPSILPTRAELFGALYVLCNGQGGGWWALGADAGVSLVNRSNHTSTWVHIGTMILTYCIRFHGDREQHPIPPPGSSEASGFWVLMANSYKFYIAWMVFQYFIPLGWYWPTVLKKNLECGFREPLFGYANSFSKSHRKNRLMFFAMHWGVSSFAFHTSPFLYHNQSANFWLIVLSCVVIVGNCGTEVFRKFTHQSYDQELRTKLGKRAGALLDIHRERKRTHPSTGEANWSQAKRSS